MPALHKVELRRGRSNGYRYMYEVVAMYVDGSEKVLFESPSYIEACMFRPEVA